MRKAQIDNRIQPRVLDRVPFTLNIVRDNKTKVRLNQEPIKALDISEGGLRFYDEHQLPDGTILEINLQTAVGRDPITQLARVRWTYPVPDKPGFDIGVQFIEATSSDQSAWNAYVNQRLDKVGVLNFPTGPI